MSEKKDFKKGFSLDDLPDDIVKEPKDAKTEQEKEDNEQSVEEKSIGKEDENKNDSENENEDVQPTTKSARDHSIGYKVKTIRDVKKDKELHKNQDKTNDVLRRIILVTIFIVIIGVTLVNITSDKNVYLVKVNDKEIGYMEDSRKIQDVLNKTKQNIEKEIGQSIKINEKIQPVFTHASAKNIISEQQMMKNLKINITYKVKATVVVINGVQKAAVKDDNELQEVLNTIKSKYVKSKGQENNIVEFVENVKSKPEFINKEEILSKEKAIDLFTNKQLNYNKYIVKEGDSLWTIAKSQGISIQDIISANQGFTENTVLKINKPINLFLPKPMLNVRTKEKIVYTETIAKATEERKDPTKYKDYRKTIQVGKDGKKEVVGYNVKINGVEIKKEISSEKVIQNPITEIIVEGTKPNPPKSYIGIFSIPTMGRLTSFFGDRGDSIHEGIDIAAPIGTPIFASYDGTVVFCGEENGYGNIIKIDHGYGFKTVYAHVSETFVKNGDTVQKGQKIASVGNTGRSTGPHLHFELRKDEVAQNPLNFIR